MSSQPVIRIVDLWKSFGENDVLRGVSLDVMEGETLVVLGPSGCGKSVLLKHIIGLMVPDRGSIIVEGCDVTTVSGKELNRLRQRFGMVFQGAALFDSMSIGENVGLPMVEHRGMRGAELEQQIADKLEAVGLSGIEGLRPSEISGGMKKRVALARAIALDPDVILYDEPTTGLDPVMAEQINELIRSVQKKVNATSVVVTHDLHSACFVGDRVALLESGEIQFLGTTDELQDSTNEAVRNFVARGHSERYIRETGSSCPF